MLKRKRISDVKIPDTVGGARALEGKLKDCSVDLGSSESANLHGYRLNFCVKGENQLQHSRRTYSCWINRGGYELGRYRFEVFW
jgi:hypothetical protein